MGKQSPLAPSVSTSGIFTFRSPDSVCPVRVWHLLSCDTWIQSIFLDGWQHKRWLTVPDRASPWGWSVFLEVSFPVTKSLGCRLWRCFHLPTVRCASLSYRSGIIPCGLDWAFAKLRQLWIKGHRGLGVLDNLIQKEQILTELMQIYCHGKEDYLIWVSEFWRDQVRKKR